MKRTMIDTAAADELFLYITNSREIYEQMKYIFRNLHKKVNKGMYAIDKAVQAYAHITVEGAKAYVKEFSTGNYYDNFNAATRKEVCERLESYYRDNVIEGDF